MGLDMFLNAKRFLFSSLSEDKDTKIARKIQKLFPELKNRTADYGGEINKLPVVNEIQIHIGYWRKANQTHKWFVSTVQNNIDDCEKYHVSREQIQSLLDLCNKVMTTKNTNLLPPTSGFCFGSTDIDEWYWQDIENTIAICTSALQLPEQWVFEYTSSW